MKLFFSWRQTSVGAGTNFVVIVLVIAIAGVGLEIMDPNFLSGVFGFQGRIMVTAMGGTPLASIVVPATINGQTGSTPFTASVTRIVANTVSVPQTSGGYTFSGWSTGENTLSITVHVYVFDVQLFAYYSSGGGGTTSITLYTVVWNSVSNSWQAQGGVSVTVSGASGGIWTTGSDGSVTQNVVAGSYSFSASYGGYSNSTSLTIASGEQKSVTLYFGLGSVTPTLFSDGFESGSMNVWTGIQRTNSTNVTHEVTGSLKHSGTYAYHATCTGDSGGVGGYVYETLNSTPTDLYARGYFYPVLSLASDGQYVELMKFAQGSPAADIATARVYRQAGVLVWGLVAHSPVYTTAYGGTVTTNVWHSLEMHVHVDVAAGYLELFVDGGTSALLRINGLNTAGLTLDRVRMGMVWKSAGVTSAPQLYMDDCVIDDAKIGS